MCRVQDCEPWKVFVSKHRKARKEHQCCECERAILKGEIYYYAKGLMEDRWDYLHMCSHCEAASKWLMEVCRGYLFYGVLEELEEHFFDEDAPISSIGLGRLVVRMRHKWRNYRGELVEVPTWAEELGHETYMALREIELIDAFEQQTKRRAAA